MMTASACGKIILFGEHAVVYGRPALAVPLSSLRARVRIEEGQAGGTVIHALNLEREVRLEDASSDDALAAITRLGMAELGVIDPLEIFIESEIPVASGFGSGAAISTAIVRAIAAYSGIEVSPARVSALVYETEKLYHGTPSGVDNTVIAYEQPVRFMRGQDIRPFTITRPFELVIANTGIASPTKITVGDVRRGWESDKPRYEALFDRVGAIVQEAQGALARGENERLGALMLGNQRALQEIGVSSPEIEQLISVGLRAGAGGGKLSGGGRGGNVIFYVQDTSAAPLERALRDAGGASVIVTRVG